jgi:hypothetical protein
MTQTLLRKLAFSILAVWIAIWFLFLMIRMSPFDIRVIPGIGAIMLLALAAALLAPVAATGIAVFALCRGSRAPLDWIVLGCAAAALVGQTLLFGASGWM